MGIYWFNLFSILFYALALHVLSNKTKLPEKALFCIIIFLQWFVLAVFRAETVGWDTPTYIEMFTHLNSNPGTEERYEPLYIGLNLLIGKISLNYIALFIAIAVIAYYGILSTIYRMSSIVWFSIFLFVAFGFFNFSINILRQTLALSFVMISLRYIVSRELLKFLGVMTIAAMFHYSALIFIITYFLYKIHISLRSYIIFWICCAFLAFIVFPKFASSLISSMKLYAHYFNPDDNSGYGMLAMLTATSVGCLILKPTQLNPTVKLWYVMMYIASGLQLISIQVSIFVRIIMYWQIGMIFIFPALLQHLYRPVNRYIVFSIAFAASIIYYYLYVTTYSEVNGTIPYKSIF